MCKTRITITWAEWERILRENAKRAREMKENVRKAQGRKKESEEKESIGRKEQKDRG